MLESIDRPLSLERRGELWVGGFAAMASPCEVLMRVEQQSRARALLETAALEAWRIEKKFSRYRDDGIVPRINNSAGAAVEVDDETVLLLDFAYQCFELSGGLFDISSGVLRKVWSFKAGAELPTAEQVAALLPAIGLDKACWQKPFFSLPAGMQIDFGGIGKEYAVDRSLQLLRCLDPVPTLVNYGGDIACTAQFAAGEQQQAWQVGIEQVAEGESEIIDIVSGALATSGSTQRFLIADGKRYSHVLNPLTGWPVENPPLSITVAAASCSQAGMLATFAMLQGSTAEAFLKQQGVTHWCRR